MPNPLRILTSFGLAASLFHAADVRADSMNPALGRLVMDQECHAVVAADGTFQNFGQFNDSDAARGRYLQSTGRDSCAPDHAAFKRLINQWGFVLAPSAMHSARTTGFGGFHFSLEGVYTKIDDGAMYWKLGTRGPRDPSTNEASIINNGPASMLQVYSIKARKSFGFGLELATQVGFVPSTTLLTGGSDVRMSLLEGFRTGALGILPDVAVGGGVRTITGTPEFQLTTVGLDVQISKPLTISSSSRLTPWVGYQYLWIFGDSGLIDTTPATDPLGYCGYTGPNLPGNGDTFREEKAFDSATNTPQTFDGQPVCAGGSPIDFNNNVVFDNARLERQRMMFGLNYQFEMVMLGAQFITDIVDPSSAQVGDDSIRVFNAQTQEFEQINDEEVLDGVPRQWSLVFELGAMF